MTSTIYTDFQNPAVNAAWLNDVNSATYNAAGGIPGSIPRTALSKFSDSISVKDFGAVGDGVTMIQHQFNPLSHGRKLTGHLCIFRKAHTT